MPVFHWVLVSFFALVLVLLAVSTRRRRASTEEAEEAPMQECSLCGREDHEQAFIARQFMSGYHHHLCGPCVAELHGEALGREILPQGSPDDAEGSSV
jgi:hypothetical protein